MIDLLGYDLQLHPHSFADPDGQLFFVDGQLYRGIRSAGAPLMRQLFQSGVFQRLVEQGLLVETTIAPIRVAGFELVLRHRALPFPSYPTEWCPAMLRDAAVAMIALAIELAKHDLILRDAHPWNVLFDACRPVYVDVTSMLPAGGTPHWPAYDEFCRFCLYPLLLMAGGHERIARLLMWEDGGVRDAELAALMGRAPQPRVAHAQIERLLGAAQRATPEVIRRMWRGTHTLLAAQPWMLTRRRRARIAQLRALRQQLEHLTFPGGEPRLDGPPLDDPDGWTAKQRAVHDALAERRPASLLDIGSGAGWYARLAAAMRIDVVAFDSDSACVTNLYRRAREERLPILPLLMDFTKPTPARGLADHWSIAAAERFRCEMVLALGLVHMIVLERGLNFDQIVGGLALFAERWLIVEFVPPDDCELVEQRSKLPDWYTLEHFLGVLRRRFRCVAMAPSWPPRRVLALCEV
jgi:hypothetical protein